MKKVIFTLIILFSAVFIYTACGGAVSEDLSRSLDLKKEENKVYIGSNSANNGTAQTNEDKNFASKLYSLMDNKENYVISPLSLKYAMAMAANGADEETKSEIMNALGITDLEDFNSEVKAYIESMAAEDEETDEAVSDSGSDIPELFIDDGVPEKTSLSIANSIWLNSDKIAGGDFSEAFKTVVKDSYSGEALSVTDKNAVETINSWCSEKTKDKIDSIINNSDFLAALVNAVYFKGTWAYEFDEDLTEKDIFTNSDGSESETEFMRQTDEFKYYEDENIQIIALPYADSSINMYIALTEDDTTDALQYAGKTSYEKVRVKIPKFKTETSLSGLDLFKALGVKKAFDGSADAYHFTPMFNETVNNASSVYISEILHKTYISVDEEGTEAAAVTSLMMSLGSAPGMEEKIYEFTADRPFTYFIKDESNGEILFMGR
ncbi:MAG: serpin family protein, partial [Eubacterium sp.]|nr:serpin family protein [Eubacterium sp.]